MHLVLLVIARFQQCKISILELVQRIVYGMDSCVLQECHGDIVVEQLRATALQASAVSALGGT